MAKNEALRVIAIAVLAFIVGFAVATTLNKTPEPTKSIELSKLQEQINALQKYYKLAQGVDVSFSIDNIAYFSDYVEVNVTENNTGQKGTLYFTYSYEFLAGKPIKLTEIVSQFEESQKKQEEQFKQEMKNFPKKEKPEIKLYIMSFCPYGNQAELAMKEVISSLADRIAFEPIYIISGENGNFNSLHGKNELNQDIREKIIWKLYGTKAWINYATAVDEQCSLDNIETCWKDIAQQQGLNITEIEELYNQSYNLIAEQEANESVKKGIGASPTLTINGKLYNLPRTPYYYGNAICYSFVEMPEECSSLTQQSSNYQQPKQVSGGSCG